MSGKKLHGGSLISLVALSTIFIGGFSTIAYSQVEFRADVGFQNEDVRDMCSNWVALWVITTSADGFTIYDVETMDDQWDEGETIESFEASFVPNIAAVRWYVWAVPNPGCIVSPVTCWDDEDINFQNLNQLNGDPPIEFWVDPDR